MSKLSLLDMVQQTLSAMDSDDVNSIDDTVESQQVATIVRECYDELVASREWPFLRTSFSIDGLADLSNPTHMQIPEGVSKIEWIKYDKQDVDYIDPKSFQDLLDMRVETPDVVDSNGFILNRNPIYFTQLNDTTLVFDSIDLAVDTTLQESKTVAYGTRIPTWTHEDSFVPDLPARMFPMLLAEVKSTAFLNLKQQANSKEERRAQRGRNTFQNESWRVKDAEYVYNSRVNYGRK